VCIIWKLKCWILLMHGVTMKFNSNLFGLQTFTARIIQTVVCWLVTPCRALGGYSHCGERCCLCLQSSSYLSIFDVQFFCWLWPLSTSFLFSHPSQPAYIIRPLLRPTQFDLSPCSYQIPGDRIHEHTMSFPNSEVCKLGTGASCLYKTPHVANEVHLYTACNS